MINYIDRDFYDLRKQFLNAEPFNHVVLDNFFYEDFALAIANEFPNWNDPEWNRYDNAIEKKKTLNIWDKFKENTYCAFTELLSIKTVDSIASMADIGRYLYADIGLHGGGQHAHSCGDKLNIHLDYSIHPKLKMERRLNIIIYMTPNWQEEWGGGLELWSHDATNNQPKECVVKVVNKFNRAIIFDTRNSWHGLPTPITCPEGVYRNSLAAYYLSDSKIDTPERYKALFAPTFDQQNDQDVLDLIRKRSSLQNAASVYTL